MPKTASSEREVDTLAPVIVELEEQRTRTQLRGELVFLNEDGGPLDLTNFRERNWKRILVKASTASAARSISADIVTPHYNFRAERTRSTCRIRWVTPISKWSSGIMRGGSESPSALAL